MAIYELSTLYKLLSISHIYRTMAKLGIFSPQDTKQFRVTTGGLGGGTRVIWGGGISV